VKYNLKNRPRSWKVTEVEDWFEGFEVELRERIKDCDKYPLAPGNEGYHVLREVLGE